VTEVYFFGCWNDLKGHHLWQPRPARYESVRHRGLIPWTEIDGALTPGNRGGSSLYAMRDNHVESSEQVEGLAALHHHDGWTALAWWDRSVDMRHGSNAALFARGEHDVAAMLKLGRQHFPTVMARFRYTIDCVRT
jgi:hypothetical protein